MTIIRIVPMILLALSAAAGAAGIAFPGPSFVVSPDSQWVVHCRGGLRQGYLLEASRSRDTGWTQLWVVARRCDVLWRRDGNAVALTDWYGSNASQVVVVDLEHPDGKTPLLGLVPSLSEFLRKEERKGHLYWEALEWNGDSLRIRAFGHTDGFPFHGFSYEFLVNPTRRTALLLRKGGTAELPDSGK
jgi:hypothetical protein